MVAVEKGLLSGQQVKGATKGLKTVTDHQCCQKSRCPVAGLAYADWTTADRPPAAEVAYWLAFLLRF